MQNTKIKIDNNVIDMITLSDNINDNDKLNLLKFIWYMTVSEKKELISTL